MSPTHQRDEQGERAGASVRALPISESGRRAFLAGLKASDNPFHIGSQARSLWARGWREARDAAAITKVTTGA